MSRLGAKKKRGVQASGPRVKKPSAHRAYEPPTEEQYAQRLESFGAAEETERYRIACSFFEDAFPRDERFMPAFALIADRDFGWALSMAWEQWASRAAVEVLLAKVAENESVLDPLDPPEYGYLCELCTRVGTALPPAVRERVLAILAGRIEEFAPIPGHPGSEAYLHDMLEVYAELEGPLLSAAVWERILGWHRNWYPGVFWPPNEKCRCNSGLKYKRCCGNPAYPVAWLEERHRGGPLSAIDSARLSELIIPGDVELLRDRYHPHMTDAEVRGILLERAREIAAGRKPAGTMLGLFNPHHSALRARFEEGAAQDAFPIEHGSEDEAALEALVAAQDAFVDSVAKESDVDRDAVELTFEEWLEERHRRERAAHTTAT